MSFTFTTQFDTEKYLQKLEFEDNGLDITDKAASILLEALSRTLGGMSKVTYRIYTKSKNKFGCDYRIIYARVTINKETKNVKTIELIKPTRRTKYNLTTFDIEADNNIKIGDIDNCTLDQYFDNILFNDYGAKSICKNLVEILFANILTSLERLAKSQIEFLSHSKNIDYDNIESAVYNFENNSFIVNIKY